ncbi:hypothetical protein DBP19_36470 [Streptomyces sp. CS090A]|uniref:hypothetical protein n=1 Tax=Streptomyces sp. CS090A TaxID=2162710 RepID=UPI000D51B3CE|nr:hypothetical protein [Streptomyces sp. CS090A]PVC80636.1 hypothetical protein DBP19_36470 [Streptomyces sp. CS090A]
MADRAPHPNPVHTAGNAVPPLDTDLAGTLDDLDGIHPGIDLIRDGIRLLALDRHTTDGTQTLLAALAGSAGADVITAIGNLVARLATADHNPALRTLPLDTQKAAQRHGEQAAFHLSDPDLAAHASEASAAITDT